MAQSLGRNWTETWGLFALKSTFLPDHKPCLPPCPTVLKEVYSLRQQSISLVLWVKGYWPMICHAFLTIIAGEVLNGYILDWDFLEEVGLLASRISCYNPFLSEPFSQPCQMTVTVERIGQKVSKHHIQTMQSLEFIFLFF